MKRAFLRPASCVLKCGYPGGYAHILHPESLYLMPQPTTPFTHKHILLGVSGSISTYKAVGLASRLVQAGATVDVLMTEAALKMVTPLSFQAITHRPVLTDMWTQGAEIEVGHVTLAKEADALLIAPATANTLAKVALGFADNYLTTTALALRGAMVVAPAMETGMWFNPATQGHVRTLTERGVWLVPPEEGYLASGALGTGRLAAEEKILAMLEQALGPNDLKGVRVLVTAGGTQEAIDPVRYISNHSSGKMGYAVAEAAARRGAEVTLVSGPVALSTPIGVKVISVSSAEQMLNAVLEALPATDVLLKAAAVADYRPADPATHKIKKKDEELSIPLMRNPDILLAVKEHRHEGLTVVGWAAETNDLVAYAEDKLRRKGLDMIVANPVPQSFAGDTVQATLLRRDGTHDALEPMPKRELANRILDEVVRVRRNGGTRDAGRKTQ